MPVFLFVSDPLQLKRAPQKPASTVHTSLLGFAELSKMSTTCLGFTKYTCLNDVLFVSRLNCRYCGFGLEHGVSGVYLEPPGFSRHSVRM